MPQQTACAAHCGRVGQKGQHLCRACYYELPDDLRERLRWARENGTSIEREAARRAVDEYLNI